MNVHQLQSVPGVVESMKIVTIENSERVARYAFEYGKFIERKKKQKNIYTSYTDN